MYVTSIYIWLSDTDQLSENRPEFSWHMAHKFLSEFKTRLGLNRCKSFWCMGRLPNHIKGRYLGLDVHILSCYGTCQSAGMFIVTNCFLFPYLSYFAPPLLNTAYRAPFQLPPPFSFILAHACTSPVAEDS